MSDVECRIGLRPGIAGGWSECCESYGNDGSAGSDVGTMWIMAWPGEIRELGHSEGSECGYL